MTNTVVVVAPVAIREVAMGRILTLVKPGDCSVVAVAALARTTPNPVVKVKMVLCGLFGVQTALFLQLIQPMCEWHERKQHLNAKVTN
jgi:hypothetical protein